MSTSLIIMILESGRKIQLYALQRVYKYVLKVSIMPWSHLPKDGALLQENIKRNFPLHIAKSKIPRKGLQDGMLKNIKMCKRGKERTGEHESMSPCFIQPHWKPSAGNGEQPNIGSKFKDYCNCINTWYWESNWGQLADAYTHIWKPMPKRGGCAHARTYWK